jgi:hypothetical protein
MSLRSKGGLTGSLCSYLIWSHVPCGYLKKVEKVCFAHALHVIQGRHGVMVSRVRRSCYVLLQLATIIQYTNLSHLRCTSSWSEAKWPRTAFDSDDTGRPASSIVRCLFKGGGDIRFAAGSSPRLRLLELPCCFENCPLSYMAGEC